jgi:KDO2-lipid IV(A) lauroyltransferase
MLRWLTSVALGALNRLAADTAARVGGGIGVLAWRIGVRRRVVSEVLERTLGLQGVERQRIARRSYATMGATFLELWTVGGPSGPEDGLRVLAPRWMALIHRRHPACAYVTPHLGAWDVGAYGTARVAGTLFAYAKAQHSPEVDRLTNVQRERLGYRVLLARHGERTTAVTAMRALRGGASLALMADQKPADEESAPARFLGLPTNSHRGPAFFAERGQVPLVPCLCVRVRAGASALFIGRPLVPRPGMDLTQAVMDWYSAMVAAFPGQYFWHHKRFNGTPPELPPRAREPWRERGLRLLVEDPTAMAERTADSG